jgi:hypothetical protein
LKDKIEFCNYELPLLPEVKEEEKKEKKNEEEKEENK